jgi:predicted outer membrane protein
MAKGFKVGVAAGLSKEERGAYDNLARLKSRDFDRQFLAVTTELHEKMVKSFGGPGKGLKDENLQRFVKNNLPDVRDNLKRARALYDVLKDK